MALLTFSDHLRVLRTRGSLPDLHNFMLIHTEELAELIESVEQWYDAKRFERPTEREEKRLVKALNTLTEKQRRSA